MSTKNTTALVQDVKRQVRPSSLNRGSLEVGDLFKRPKGKGRVYMHTGTRTTPPSELGKRVSLGILPNGDHIVGYQSIVVQGVVKSGEDGAMVTFNNDPVNHVGRASITLSLFNGS